MKFLRAILIAVIIIIIIILFYSLNNGNKEENVINLSDLAYADENMHRVDIIDVGPIRYINLRDIKNFGEVARIEKKLHRVFYVNSIGEGSYLRFINIRERKYVFLDQFEKAEDIDIKELNGKTYVKLKR